MNIRRLYKYTAIWTFIGFAAGCLLYLALHCLFGMDVGFWETALVTAGYFGYFIGFVGGFVYICRHMDDR